MAVWPHLESYIGAQAFGTPKEMLQRGPDLTDPCVRAKLRIRCQCVLRIVEWVAGDAAIDRVGFGPRGELGSAQVVDSRGEERELARDEEELAVGRQAPHLVWQQQAATGL